MTVHQDGGAISARADRHLGVVLLLMGVAGLVAAFVLTVERFRVLENPFYVPSCSLSEVLSCKTVMQSEQAAVFGVPNSLLGMVGFSAVATTGGALIAGARPAPWFWRTLVIGLAAAVVFVHWLVFQTLYRIGALCPYCMVVWIATVVSAWYLALRVARVAWPSSSVARWCDRNHALVPAGWLLLVASAVFLEFYAPW